MAICLSSYYGLKDVIVESDCQTVINRLSKQTFFLSHLDIVLHLHLSSIIWSYGKRDENFVAHHLAKPIPFGIEQIWENHSPPKMAPLEWTICPLK